MGDRLFADAVQVPAQKMTGDKMTELTKEMIAAALAPLRTDATERLKAVREANDYMGEGLFGVRLDAYDKAEKAILEALAARTEQPELECETCGGEGEVRPRSMTEWEPCPTCGGRKRLPQANPLPQHAWRPCPDCQTETPPDPAGLDVLDNTLRDDGGWKTRDGYQPTEQADTPELMSLEDIAHIKIGIGHVSYRNPHQIRALCDTAFAAHEKADHIAELEKKLEATVAFNVDAAAAMKDYRKAIKVREAEIERLKADLTMARNTAGQSMDAANERRDRITALKAENARMRERMGRIRNETLPHQGPTSEKAKTLAINAIDLIARKALEGEQS